MSHLRRHCSGVRNAADHFVDELTTFCSVAISTCSYAVGATGHVSVWSNALTTGQRLYEATAPTAGDASMTGATTAEVMPAPKRL